MLILKSMFSMAALNVIKAACSLLISFFVAKTVAPDAFGLVSFAIPLMTFITILTDLGLVSAIVRHPELSPRESGAAISLFLIAGLVGGGVLIASAHPLEHLVGLDGLAPVVAGFGIVALFTIWAAAPRALLEREYRYNQVVIVEFLALLLGLLACGVAVFAHYGVLAIVAYQVTLQVVRAAGFLILSRNLHQFNADWKALSSLISVGGWLLATNLLTYFARNSDNLLIGSFLGARTLGIYGLAYQFMTLPLVLLTWPVSGVLLSTLSRLRHDESARQDVICAVVACTAAITFPMMAVLTFAANVPIQLIYSNTWEGLAVAIALLAPAGAIQSVAAYCGAVLIEQGRVRLNFVLSTFIGGGMTAVFFATVWFGLVPLMASYMLFTIIAGAANIYYICKVGRISFLRMLYSLAPGTLAVAAGVGGTYLTVGLHSENLTQWIWTVTIYTIFVTLVLLISLPSLWRSVNALGQLSVKVRGAAASVQASL